MRLYAFGSNASGQLGIGSTEDASTPQVCRFPNGSELPGVPVKIVAGGNHTLLLLDDGVVYCTGAPRDGTAHSEPSQELQTTFRKAYISTSDQDKVKLCSAYWEGTCISEHSVARKAIVSSLCNCKICQNWTYVLPRSLHYKLCFFLLQQCNGHFPPCSKCDRTAPINLL